jgi:hypothetical protein
MIGDETCVAACVHINLRFVRVMTMSLDRTVGGRTSSESASGTPERGVGT